ncbi:MAG: SUMF1/EgtB/PvdO family nonheme iron enzyme, partial [Bacteroidales bacterium]|nr:SUMF1/EgtB/PvdO family nonheme iron enzyme [Bacteroidales bacterium]
MIPRIPFLLSLFAMISCGAVNPIDTGEDPAKPEDPAVEISVPDNYVKVETTGSYTFIATSSNVAGGETVSIPKEYYICKYAVTNSEWEAYIDATGASAPNYWNGKSIPEGREKHPVLWISCTEAEAYCKWLSDKTEGWTFRLPTSAEWEFAAAGTARTAYPWGEKADASY